jgi:hypothetical protein
MNGISPTLVSFLDQLYAAQERLTRDEIQRRAVSSDLPAEAMSALDGLPEGAYSYDEVTAALASVEGVTDAAGESDGIPPTSLPVRPSRRSLRADHHSPGFSPPCTPSAVLRAENREGRLRRFVADLAVVAGALE